MTKPCDLSELSEICQFREKWRFTPVPEDLRAAVEKLSQNPRQTFDPGGQSQSNDLVDNEVTRAFVRAGVGVDSEYGQWLQAGLEEGSWIKTSAVRCQLKAPRKRRVDVEIPALVRPLSSKIVDPQGFKLLWARPWKNPGEHITLKEARVILSSLKRTCRVSSLFGCKKVTVSDNLGAVLAFEKGRSSTPAPNALCRRAAALLCATGCKWRIRHVETKRNVADGPSRWFEGGGIRHREFHKQKEERIHEECKHQHVSPSPKSRCQICLSDCVPPPGLDAPVEDAPTQNKACGLNQAEAAASSSFRVSADSTVRKPAGKRLRFWEIFSGCGSLTRAMRKRGCRVLPPIDISRSPFFDLTKPHVQEAIKVIIVSGQVDYIHFGTPCTVFSRARRGITNWRKSQHKETVGCELAALTAELCCLCSRHGVMWSIENPRSSRLWEFPLFDVLYSLPNAHCIDFDMCCYGTDYKKPTRILTNWSCLDQLHAVCTHVRHTTVLKGKVRVVEPGGSRWVNRTTLAGAYPPDLVHAWASATVPKRLNRDDSKKFGADDEWLLHKIEEAQHQQGKTSRVIRIDEIPHLKQCVVFGQHSKAEACRRRQVRQRQKEVKAMQEALLKINQAGRPS